MCINDEYMQHKTSIIPIVAIITTAKCSKSFTKHLCLDSKINKHLALYMSNTIIKFLNIAATYRLVTAFESELPFRVSASVTRSRVVSACPSISRFPFDCFFSLPK